jgi:hypothetical protein
MNIAAWHIRYPVTCCHVSTCCFGIPVLFAILFSIKQAVDRIFMQTPQEITKSLAKLVAGSQVIVEVNTPAGPSSKFRTTFIGFLPRKFVLLQMPDVSKNLKLSGHIKDSSGCKVRSIVEGHEGAVIAFATKIKIITKMPAAMMVLQMPNEVICQQLRSSLRIDAHITFNCEVKNKPYDGHIVNLSAKGCLLEFDNDPNLSFKDRQPLSLCVELAELGKLAHITCEVCNIKNLHNHMHIGVEFTNQPCNAVTALLSHAVFEPQ